jgi:hypothetical protein
MMDRLAAAWLWVGERFRRRPIAVVGLILGAVIFASGITYVLIEQNNTENDIRKVQDVICNNSGPYTARVQKNCHHLLDQLLKNPTPQQAKRLKQIIKESQ